MDMPVSVNESIDKLRVIDIKLASCKTEAPLFSDKLLSQIRNLKEHGVIFAPCSCSRQLLVFSEDMINRLPGELRALAENPESCSDSLEVTARSRPDEAKHMPRCFSGRNAYRHLLGYFSGTETIEPGDPHMMSDAKQWWQEFCKVHNSNALFADFYNPIFTALFQDASNIRGDIQENKVEPTYAHSLFKLIDMKPANKVVVIAPERDQKGVEINSLRNIVWLIAGQNPKRAVEEIIITHSDGSVARDFHASLYTGKNAPPVTVNTWSCALEDLIPDNGAISKLADSAFVLMGCPLADPKNIEQIDLERSIFATWSRGRKGKSHSRLVFLADDNEIIRSEGHLKPILDKVVSREQIKEQYAREKERFFDGINKSHYATYLFTHARALGGQVDAKRIARVITNNENLGKLVGTLIRMEAADFKASIGYLASGKGEMPKVLSADGLHA